MSKPLPDEGKIIYRMLFPGRPIPNDFRERYIRALHDLALEEHPNQTGLNRLLQAGADLEAAEVYLRSRSAGNLLTVKCRLVSYLAETSDDNYELFVNDKPGHWMPIACLGVGYVLRTLYKRLKGKYYAVQYGL